MELPPDDAFQNPYVKRLRWIGLAVIVGMIGVLAASYFLPVGIDPSTRAMSDRVEWEMRLLGEAIEAYRLDHGSTPAPRPLREMAGPTAELELLREAGGWDVTGVEPGGLGPAGVLRPKAYLERLYADVFGPLPGLTPGYVTDGEEWILFSPGPDRMYDLGSSIDPSGSSDQWIPRMYDPTNGAESAGDLVLTSKAQEEPAP